MSNVQIFHASAQALLAVLNQLPPSLEQTQALVRLKEVFMWGNDAYAALAQAEAVKKTAEVQPHKEKDELKSDATNAPEA